MRHEDPTVFDRDEVAVLTAEVGGQRVGFPLVSVHEVLPAMETTGLANAPEVIRGVVNLRGEPLPVLDLRARLGLPTRPADPDDHVLVCQLRGRRVGVWVDRALDVDASPGQALVPLPEDAPSRHAAGAVLLEDGLLLVVDVDSFLSVDEVTRLSRALAEEALADA